MRPRLVIYSSRFARPSQRWRWRLLANNGRIVAVGGEGYSDRAAAQEMAMRVVCGTFGDPKVEWK